MNVNALIQHFMDHDDLQDLSHTGVVLLQTEMIWQI
jgi:hypothetical protein